MGSPLARRHGIEEHVQRRDLAIANGDHVQARVVGHLDSRTGTPSQTTGIVERLRLAVRRLDEVRVGRAEIASEFLECCTPGERSG